MSNPPEDTSEERPAEQPEDQPDAQQEPTSERNEVRDASILVFGRFMAMVAEAIMPFVIVRLLGKADFGAFTGLMLIYTTLSVVLTAGFPAAILFFLAGRDAEARFAISRRLFGAVMGLGVIIGVVLYVVGLVGNDVLDAFGQWVSDDPQGERADLSYLKYFVAFPVLDVLARVFPNFLIAENRASKAATFGVLRAIGMSAGMVIPAALGLGVPGIVGGLTLFSLIQGAWIGRVFMQQYRGVAHVPSEVSLGEMARFAYPLGLTDIINNLNAAIDRYAILLLMSAQLFAEYRAGAWQLPITAIAYSVGHVYMPRFVELIKAEQPMTVIDLWRESIHKVSLIIIPICMIFVVGAEEFIRVAFTDDYLGAAQVFRIYVIYTMGRVASFGVLILAAGRSPLLFKASSFALVSNLVLTIPLALWLGFIGPALGTLLAFIPMVAVYCYYIADALKVPFTHTFPVFIWLKVVLAASAAAIPAVLLKNADLLHPLVGLVAYAIIIIPMFTLIGRVTGLISSADLAFGLGWVRLKFLKSQG